MRVIEIQEMKRTDAQGLKSYIVLSYGCYTDKKTGGVCIAGLMTAQQIKAKSERGLLAKLALKSNLAVITGAVNFPADSHGMRQRGATIRVSADFKPLLLESEAIGVAE
jgi:hypothetical protein